MITDGYIEFPKEVPTYPVIWVLMNNTGTVPPFGSIIRVD
jgi:predicted metal-dependent peptidase